MTTKLTYLMTAYYTPNDSIIVNDIYFVFITRFVSYVQYIHVAVSFQLIMYAKITTVNNALGVCCQAARSKEHKLEAKFFCKN